MKISYGDGWFRSQKRVTRELDEAEARLCFALRKMHVVLVGDAKAPTCYIEFSKDYVGVGFLDGMLRESHTYQFTELEPGRLFLGMAVHRDFIGDTDQNAQSTAYFFNPDGRLWIKRKDFINKSAENTEAVTDITNNWEPYPEFGKYESIIRKERSVAT